MCNENEAEADGPPRQTRLSELNATVECRIAERPEALRESAALLKAVADNTSVGLVLIDRNHRYKFANDVYMKILGRTESIIGKTPAECLPPTYNNQTGPRLEKAFAGERFAFEAAMPSPAGAPGKMNYYSAVYEPEFDSQGAIIGAVVVIIDITEQKEREDHIRLLMNEINHRSKNLLSVVAAIAKQTSASSPSDFMDRFTARLKALAISQDLLVKSRWKSIEASELLRCQLAHLVDLVDQRISLDGPPLSLCAAAAEAIGMVVHELSTNAVKYGALSGQTGTVHISWRLEQSPAGEQFLISWVERDGPPVEPPTRRGFGTTVVTKLVEMNLDGESELEYAPSGLIWRFSCRASSARAGGAI